MVSTVPMLEAIWPTVAVDPETKKLNRDTAIRLGLLALVPSVLALLWVGRTEIFGVLALFGPSLLWALHFVVGVEVFLVSNHVHLFTLAGLATVWLATCLRNTNALWTLSLKPELSKEDVDTAYRLWNGAHRVYCGFVLLMLGWLALSVLAGLIKPSLKFSIDWWLTGGSAVFVMGVLLLMSSPFLNWLLPLAVRQSAAQNPAECSAATSVMYASCWSEDGRSVGLSDYPKYLTFKIALNAGQLKQLHAKVLNCDVLSSEEEDSLRRRVARRFDADIDLDVPGLRTKNPPENALEPACS